MQNLWPFRPLDRFFVFRVDFANRQAYQFGRGFGVGLENGILGKAVSKDTA
jgi:hypothetical protein